MLRREMYTLYTRRNSITENFAGQEFRCPDCNRIYVALELCESLEVLRKTAGGKPIRILSGYRCPVRNRAAGGTPRSWHTVGLAADIAAREMPWAELWDLVRELQGKGFFEFAARYTRNIHVDLRP